MDEKVEGRHVGWMPIPFFSLLTPFPVSCYCSTPSFLLFFSSPLELSKDVCGNTVNFSQCQRNNDSQLQKLERIDGIRSAPIVSQVVGDASRRYHMVVAPTETTETKQQQH